MAFAPYINANRTADQGKVLGCFREKDYGLTFEYAERTDATTFDMRHRRGQVIKKHLNLTRRQIDQGGACTLVGHMQHIAARHGFK